MNMSRLALGLIWIGLVSAANTAPSSASPATSSVPVLYVTIDVLEPLDFRHYRRALGDGSELILTTLRQSAAEQARLAHCAGEVVVLDEKAAPPAKSPVLRLTWTVEAVAAELIPADGGKAINLGIVSGLPLTQHPDYDRMHAEISRQGLKDHRRDALLRAQTQMNLYLALQRANRILQPR